MELVVDLSAATVTLRGARDVERFAVRVLPARSGDAAGTEALGALAAALSLAHAGSVNPDGEVSVVPDAVRRLAGDDADAAWEESFAGMLAAAATKGWIDDDGSIRAHVEWGDA